MPRIEEMKEVGYFFVIPKKPKFDTQIINVSSNNNNTVIQEKEIPQVNATREPMEFKYDLPLPKLMPPTTIIEDREIAMVKMDENDGLIPERDIAMVAPNANTIELLDTDMKMVYPNANTDEVQLKDMAMVAPNVNTTTATDTSMKMVAPNVNTTEITRKDMAMVAPNVNTNKPTATDMKMIYPNVNTTEVDTTGMKMVHPMTKTDPVPSNRPGVVWSKGVAMSKFPMVKGADMGESLKNHFNDTINRMTTGFKDDINTWMKEKQAALKKEFHDFVSKTMRDYENALMDPAQQLVKNAIKNPLGTIQDFPRNLKNAFVDVGQNLVNTSLDAALTVANKGRDVINTAISLGNTAAEAMNAVSEFFGGPGNAVPLMKTVPKLPTRQEILAKATAKINQATGFDSKAFLEKAMKGKIDRKALGADLISRPDDYDAWTQTPLWFIVSDDNVYHNEELPIILDNAGLETVDHNKDGRKKGEKSYTYMGNRESPWRNVMNGILRGLIGFQGVPDNHCDIDITPHQYIVLSDEEFNSGGVVSSLVSTVLPNYYAPPAYPLDKLGDFMISDFQVMNYTMNTEDAWNMGAYGNVPISTTFILPTQLSIRFVADANMHTHKWITAYQEYMHGFKFNLHAMRPYKMCCQDITVYALTFYGEVVYAKTFIAYPLFKDDFALLGSGGVKHFDTDWIIVGMQEFTGKPQDTLAMMNPVENPPLPGEAAAVTNTAVVDTAAVSATLESNSTNIASGEFTDEDIKTIDGHTEGFLDKVSKSSSAINKAAALLDNDQVKSLATSLGLGGVIDTLQNIDLIVKGKCNYLVVAYTNHIASPSYGKTQLPYNSTDTNATYEGASILQTRYRACDKLAMQRAKAYVESLIKKGVKKENIKVVIASCDGLPGMNHYIKGTAMAEGFYLGGIYHYTNAECQMENGDGNSQALSLNRRVDMIYFDEFIKDCPDAINEMMGAGSSDAREDEKKIDLLWNKIPKVSYGRDTFWGPSCQVTRFPSIYKSIDLGINGFTNGITDAVASTSDKQTNQEKYDEIEAGNTESSILMDSGNASESDVNKQLHAYEKGEAVKQTTVKSKNASIGNNYMLKYILSYQNFKHNMSDLKWFKEKFPSEYRTKVKFTVYSGGAPSSYIPSCSKLPQNNKKKTEFTVLTLNTTREFIQNNNSLSESITGLLNYYFNNNTYVWILTESDGYLSFFQKCKI